MLTEMALTVLFCLIILRSLEARGLSECKFQITFARNVFTWKGLVLTKIMTLQNY